MSAPLWRQIQKNNFTKLKPLIEFLELSEELQKKLLDHPRFSLNLPRRLAEKIQKNSLNDPILRQFIPLDDEQVTTPGFVADPVEDKAFQKTNKILHKYEGRALLLSTSACAMHCRYCFRQNFLYETENKNYDEELAYLKNNPTISEVILSGGDPLSLSNEALNSLLISLNSVPHLKRIRFHTRFPIGIPERIDPSFLNILESSPKQIIFIIHANHPIELDSDVTRALKKIQRLGVPLLNQSVLLKGVNDDPETLLALSSSLLNCGIIPYYLHALDPVQGAAHFHVTDAKGEELVRYIQENLSGFGAPRFVREEPGKRSKTLITNTI